MKTEIAGVSTFGMNNPIGIQHIIDRVVKESTVQLPASSIQRLTGVEQVFHRTAGVDASDLASGAALKVLKSTGTDVNSIDLVIFASASQDLIEPATAHIISAKIGASCPVMDITNACNSFVNGVQVADSFIRSGTYKRILVVTGETPSMAIRWSCNTVDQFRRAFPGYTMSDTGGAMILTAGASQHIERLIMTAHSEHWDVGLLDMGGSRNPRNPETTYFNMDGSKLFNAFKDFGTSWLKNEDWSQYKRVGVHQISTLYTPLLAEELGIPSSKLIQTVKTHGNLASNSLPVQIENILGQDFAFIGLGGGISTAFVGFKF